ncbi:uncharacterized protein LOC127082572 [Lathyrus oleraceus]|uniref:uncharacterized protein LOC127082572 n=1 Tax=Pisum sativum TaxID=3888 RepID=UPI0021D39AB8|nr:uncharacterized protein LOC127082572 [Pisum sativum]
MDMRQRRCLEFMKDYKFELSYHPSKANMVTNTLSRKSLHISMLMVRKLDLVEQIIDYSLVCIVTPRSVMLGMLKLTSSILEEIREELKMIILEEGHISSLSIHPIATKKYQDLKKMFRWQGMKKDVADIVMECFEALYDRRCVTLLYWYESGESVVLGPEII